MAELNFGILDTQAPGRIAAMPQLAQEKQSQNAMQFMQLQSAVQQNQTAALQFKKLQTDEANLTRFYDEVAKNGGPTNPVDAENQMIGSKVPHYVQLGYTLKQKRLETERSRELYTAANRQPTPAAPPSAPEPGSFGADVAQREAGITRDNYLVPPPVNRNAFNAAPAQSQTDALRARIDANLALGTVQGDKTAEILQKQLDAIGRRYTVGRTLMGSEGTVYGTAPSEPPAVAQLIEYRKTLPFGREYDAVTDMIEKSSNENYQFNSTTGRFERRQGGGGGGGGAPAPLAFVDPGIAQGVTPQLQASSVDEARRQAFNMNAAGLPVNIRGGGNALAAAPDVNALRAQPAAAAPPSNPREKLEDFQAVLALEKLGYRRTPEGNFEKISGGPADKTVVTRTPVQEVRFRKDLAADYTTVTATSQGMQDVLDSITDVRNSPGLAGATGISGMVYSFPGSQAAAAQTNLTNLKGKVTLLGKTLANQDGKIGPMAVQEWTIVRDMVAALDTAISKGEKITLDEIGKIEFAAKNVAKRVQDKFEGQYGDELSNYPQFATVPEPKSRLSGKIKPAGGISVTAPNGQAYTFDTQEKADAFKKSAGAR